MSNQNEESRDLNEILELEAPRRRWPKVLLIIFILVAAGAAGWWWYFRPVNGGPTAVSFRTAEVTKGNLEVIVSATGTLEPVTQVDVGSEISGTLETVEVDFNDAVKKGQVLARLNTTKLEAEIEQARAALAVAQAELQSAQAVAKEAKLNLARLKDTFEKSGGRLPSRRDLDEAQATYEKALAQVAMAKATIAKSRASLKTSETELAKTIIKSPINGLVLDRAVEPGQTVAASLEAPVLFTLAENLTNMKLSVSVDEADVGQVKEGQRATFVVDAYPDRKFPASITQVRFAPQDDEGVVTYDCILEVDNSDHLLRPGMTATADIVTLEVKDAVLVPNSALRFSPTMPEPGIEGAKGGQDGGFISKIMPRPPRRRRSQKTSNGPKPVDKEASKVWILEDNRPVPKQVKVGASDGVNTRIISNEIQPGWKVVISQEGPGK